MPEKKIDDTTLERVVRKVKRCLALSASPNETEATTAMRQAQALMREYRLTEIDVRLSDVGEIESKEYRITRRPTWDRQLSAIVAAFRVRPLDVKHWCKTAGRVLARAKFVGVTPAPQIAMYAYEALLAKLTAARREYVSQVRAGQRRSCYSPETAGNHFALAWVSAVYGKIQDLVPRGEEDTALPSYSSGRNLVAVEAQDKALIERYLAGKEIGKARKTPQIELDLEAQIAGLLAGQRVEINPGLATGGEHPLQLTQV